MGEWAPLGLSCHSAPSKSLPILTLNSELPYLRLASCVHLSLNEASSVSPGLDLYAGAHSFKQKLTIRSFPSTPSIIQSFIQSLLAGQYSPTFHSLSQFGNDQHTYLFYKTSHDAYKQGDLRRLFATVEENSHPPLPPIPILHS